MKKIFCILISCFFSANLNAANIDLSNISTQRLAGQMILVGFNGTGKNDYLVKKLSQEASLGKLGGVVFRAKNLQDAQNGKELIDRFANIAVANPLFLALDGNNLTGDYAYLSSEDLTNTQQPLSQARISYLKQALEIYELGFNTVIGPDLSASQNGKDLDRLSVYAQLYSQSLEQAQLVRAATHFPGTPANLRTSNKLDSYYLNWLKPYYDAIATGGADIMIVSNKIISPLDPLRPAAQSPKIMRILRQELGFKGLIASADILGGDLDSQEFKERIISSINAGCDLLYFSQSVIKYGDTASTVVNIITNAVARGQISRERLEWSYLKIIALKSKFRKRLVPEY